MGIMQITAEGKLRQILWNVAATSVGLQGLGVSVKYEDGGGTDETIEDRSRTKVKDRIALTWFGELWRAGNANA